jgi:hypothetical protein
MAGTPHLPHAGADTIVVTLPAEIDMANADQVGADLDAAFGPGVGVVIAGLPGTRFGDASGGIALGHGAGDLPAAGWSPARQ